MMQADIFDYIHPRFFLAKDRPVRLFESFSGIGFQRMALDKANIPYEVVGISEIDKYALQSYQAMYGECPNLGSITEIRGEQMPKDIDVFTYSFPCQDLSKAGKQAGLGETRSGLIYEVLRLLHEMKGNLPKVLIMENVTALYEQKFIKQWNAIRFEIEKMGYTNYSFTLNSKNFGIAQNRDRAFMVSILSEWNYVKPEEFTLTTRLKDYLEDEVDEKYYLSENFINVMTSESTGGFNRSERFEQSTHKDLENSIAFTVTTRPGQRPTDNFIKMPEATKQGYVEAHDGDGVYIDRPHQKRGVVQDGMIPTLKTSGNDVGVVVEDFYKNREPRYYEGVSPTIRAERQGLKVVATAQRGRENVQQLEVSDREYANALTTVQKDSMIGIKEKRLRIRKLTPTETGRLMTMPEHLIEKQLKTVSKSQAYKQHGNGIVADVMSYIVGMMYYETQDRLKAVIDEYNKNHCYALRKEKGDL